jgi:hypothetical protein
VALRNYFFRSTSRQTDDAQEEDIDQNTAASASVEDCIQVHGLSTELAFNRMNTNRNLSRDTKLTKKEVANMVRKNQAVSGTITSAVFACMLLCIYTPYVSHPFHISLLSFQALHRKSKRAGGSGGDSLTPGQLQGAFGPFCSSPNHISTPSTIHQHNNGMLYYTYRGRE